jgi:hypothetical protein
MMKNHAPTSLKRLITSSVLYILISLIAASVAISNNLPAQPLGENSGSGRPVLQEFLYGNGTAMSPGLPWLLAQALLTILAIRKDRLGTIAVAVLSLFGLLTGIFSLTEPAARKFFSPAAFDPFKAAVETGGILLSFLMLVFGILELVRRRRDKKIATVSSAA